MGLSKAPKSQLPGVGVNIVVDFNVEDQDGASSQGEVSQYWARSVQSWDSGKGKCIEKGHVDSHTGLGAQNVQLIVHVARTHSLAPCRPQVAAFDSIKKDTNSDQRT